ncbi:MAG: ATP-dependent metallopeptidase FtsH/Yme1/Tma family protein [Candidatus Kerfeldbacteria bacterium]|nr:ATP-dependent metallopeptidase FtsH/Yme1/Tma family protein [Candidatus Kerfeldbacteria bacterium]
MPKKQQQPKNLFRHFLGFLLIFIIIASVLSLYNSPFHKPEKVPFNTVVEYIQQGKVQDIQVIEGSQLKVTLNDEASTVVESTKESNEALPTLLTAYGITPEQLAKTSISVEGTSGWKFFVVNILPILLPAVFIIFFFWLMMRQVQGTNNRAMMFGQNTSKLVDPERKNKTTFKDVAGATEAKEELTEIVDFLKNPKKYTSIGARIPKGVLLMGPPGTGKCITGDSLVLTNKGMMRIQDVPKYFFVDPVTDKVHGAQVPAVDPADLSTATVPASHWYDLGMQQTLRIRTQLGYELEGTPEHPVLVLDTGGSIQFRRLDELKEEDKVVIKYGTKQFGYSTAIPDQETAYIIGLLIGDGCVTVRDRLIFSTSDAELLQKFSSFFAERFGYAVKKTSGPYDWMVSDQAISRLFRQEYGLGALYAKDKVIPDTILQSPEHIVRAFLQGLFDTDGTATKDGQVQFSSASKTLAKQVGCLLLNFGVVNRVHERQLKVNGKKYFYLDITGDFLRAFSEEIGFQLTRKQQRVNEYVVTHETNSNTNLLYHQQTVFSAIWKKLELAGVAVYSTFEQASGGMNYKNLIRYVSGERNPSVTTARNFTTAVMELDSTMNTLPAFNQLNRLANDNFYFTPVTKITVGEARVYDFTVPQRHSFISNGLVSHNTLLARAVAGEANVPFFHISGSEFVEMFVGVGASRVRDFFRKAQKAAPAILFIDEIDAVGRQRGTGLGGSHDEREQTLNQILTEMDGFDNETNVIVIAATNRPDVLDPALLRPGRFDRRVMLDLPDIREREEILHVHVKNKMLQEDVKLKVLAQRTTGFSGADLMNLLNEAAIFAARENHKKVSMENCLESIDKVLLGPQRKSVKYSDREKSITAYHEAGHALVAHMLPDSDPVHKITIIPRGRAGGYTLKLPEDDKKLHSKKELLADIAVALGGHAAEQFQFDDITTGASSDLSKATKLARSLVMHYGMSEKMGPRTFGATSEMVFLGKEIHEQRDYSEQTAQEIDAEIASIISTQYTVVKELMKKYTHKLDLIASKLVEVETIEREAFEALLADVPPVGSAASPVAEAAA